MFLKIDLGAHSYCRPAESLWEAARLRVRSLLRCGPLPAAASVAGTDTFPHNRGPHRAIKCLFHELCFIQRNFANISEWGFLKAVI